MAFGHDQLGLQSISTGATRMDKFQSPAMDIEQGCFLRDAVEECRQAFRGANTVLRWNSTDPSTRKRVLRIASRSIHAER